MTQSLPERIRAWLAARLGTHYAAAVSTFDRAVTAFLLAFGAKALGTDLFDVHNIAKISYWTTAGFAGLVAILSVIKSAVLTAITGDPALLAPVSATLRARRDAGRRVAHQIPVVKPRRPMPYREGSV